MLELAASRRLKAHCDCDSYRSSTSLGTFSFIENKTNKPQTKPVASAPLSPALKKSGLITCNIIKAGINKIAAHLIFKYDFTGLSHFGHNCNEPNLLSFRENIFTCFEQCGHFI